MDKIISPMQAAYVSGRQISDNIFLAQELIHTMKRKKGKKGYMALKMDMSKAFGRVEWCFLKKIMQKMGFSNKWCDLIEECISTSEISIKLNGSLCDSYKPTRRLRQGDPLSPYLFLLSVEVFTRAMADAENSNKIQGVKIFRAAPQEFSASSGQQINLQKSAVFYSKNLHPRHCRLLSRRLKVQNMSVEEMKDNSGEICFKCNVSPPKEDKDYGGLGFRDLKSLNVALLARSTWRLCKEEIQLWDRALKAKHFADSSLLHATTKKNSTWAWKSLHVTVDFIKQFSFWQVGDGKIIHIWLDKWILRHEKWRLFMLFFQPDVAAKTVQIRIPQKSKDNLVWTLTNNGLFSVKSAYNKLMELKLSSQHDYGIEKSIWKRLWKLKNDSKIKLFLWKCLTDSVSTSERLQRFAGGDVSY
ncbi:uncharacterized protein LOC113359669 [Papaver somniferum]|uniref:uncharacterized protein LOC113359669 n=1 Tax=Papaver somniferum TaxID=3469 RepID=UPI000E700BB6|nr:uncharacterized protein LOC113359669 [Papaver somniferum]